MADAVGIVPGIARHLIGHPQIEVGGDAQQSSLLPQPFQGRDRGRVQSEGATGLNVLVNELGPFRLAELPELGNQFLHD